MLRLEGREGSTQAMEGRNPPETENSGKKNPRDGQSSVHEKLSKGHCGWITVWEQSMDWGMGDSRDLSPCSFSILYTHLGWT